MDETLIIGTGAMACLFAARFTGAGYPVTMLGTWKAGIAALNEHGVRVDQEGGEAAFPVQAVNSTAELDGVQRALVLVKSWQTPRAAEQLRQVLAEDGIALSLQNGLGNLETLTEAVGSSRAAQGVTTTGATLLGPGRVRPGGEGTISIGDDPRLAPLAEGMRAAEFDVETVKDVESLIWRKLLINVGINPLTAILGVPNGKLLDLDPALTLMALAVREVEEVAAAANVELGVGDPLELVQQVAQKTATNRSSMLQDIKRGAPTEIDAICGGVVRAGERYGVPTPVNRTLTLLVQSKVEVREGS